MAEISTLAHIFRGKTAHAQDALAARVARLDEARGKSNLDSEAARQARKALFGDES